MEQAEEFQTLSSTFETKFKEKGSLFIGQAFPLNNSVIPFNKAGEGIVEAEYILDSVRKKYYDATHHCYAMSLPGGVIKYSDAGEPSGTAGIRILNAIQHFNLENVLVVVIRYFGGVKLGVGPLGKAYYNSAYMTLEAAPKIVRTIYKKFKIVFDFPQSGQVHHLLSLFQARDIRNNYTEKSEIEFLLKINSESAFRKKKEELLREDVELVDVGEIVYL